MNLQNEHKNTVTELQATHGNCFKSDFREFKKRGFIFQLQFTKPATSQSKVAIKKRFDSFVEAVKSQLKTLEKTA